MQLHTYDIECLEKVRARIDADLGRHHSIAALAATSGMGETKLKKCFRQYYKLGLFEYLQQQRMELAASLLQANDKSIKAIARICGYKYYSNFSAAFKTYYGKRPGRWRREGGVRCIEN